MRRAANRMRLRIENLVTELHRQAARFLIDSFDATLLPGFETSEMVEHGRRRIRSKIVRNLLTLAHYRFKLFLRHKADEAGVIVLDVNEAYTTKTVSWTGEVLEHLGGASMGDRAGRRADKPRLQWSAWDIPVRAGRYPRSESKPFWVRREREQLVSQRKYENQQ